MTLYDLDPVISSKFVEVLVDAIMPCYEPLNWTDAEGLLFEHFREVDYDDDSVHMPANTPRTEDDLKAITARANGCALGEIVGNEYQSESFNGNAYVDEFAKALKM